jgi:gluconolactonase
MKSSRFALACVLLVAGGCSDSGGNSNGGSGGAPASGGRGGTGGSGGSGTGGSAGSATGGSGGSGGATGGTGGSGGATGGSAGSATGGSGGSGGGGSGGGPSAADGSVETTDGLAGEVNPNARSTCPAGPFPTPVIGSAQNVCANFQFKHSYNEGPTWVASQNAFYFTNFVQRAPTQGDIIKYTPGGECEIFVSNVGCNGLAVTPDGTGIVAACHQSRDVVRFDVNTKEKTPLASMYMGQMLDTPNDLVVHSNGTIYFTNPSYELGGRQPGVGPGIFRIDPAGMISAVQMGNPPNGIGLSPDQSRLYVIGGGIWMLNESGVPSGRTNFFTGGDGMGVDCAGNVYSSGGNIFSPQGDRIGSFPGGTNLAFGGPDGKTMLIAGGGNRVRLLQMNLPGLP